VGGSSVGKQLLQKHVAFGTVICSCLGEAGAHQVGGVWVFVQSTRCSSGLVSGRAAHGSR
jgi:hypothetical protein